MAKAIPMEDWLRGCVYHDGRHGYVTLPCDEVLKIADFIERLKADRKTEPQTNADQHVQHVGSVEPTWTKEEHEAFYTFLWNVINPNEMQDYIGMFEAKDEPQTEDFQDWKDRMWAEAVIESQTERRE